MILLKDLPSIEIDGEVMYSSDIFQQAVNHLDWFKSEDYQTIPKNQNEIKEDEIFYFVHFISWFGPENVVSLYSEKNVFSDKIKELLTNPNFRLIILDVHEVHNYDYLTKIFNSFNNKERVLFINNDLNIKKICDKKNWGVNVSKTNFLIWNCIKTWKELYKKENFIKNDSKKLFLCKNKNIKLHRLYFLSYLQKNNLLKNFNYSNLDIHQWSEKNLYRIKNFNEQDYDDLYESIIQIIDNGRVNTDSELLVDEMRDVNITDSGYNFAGNIIEEDYNNTLVNVVTESVFFEPMIHLSEKTFKPFAFLQLPIFLASYNHVKNLRDYYGLDLFDDFINHEYDNIKDDTKRMKAVVDEVKRLSSKQDEVKKFFTDNQDRFYKNFTHLDLILKNKRDEDLWLRMLSF